MGPSWALACTCPLAHPSGLDSCVSDHGSRLLRRLARRVLPVLEGFPSIGLLSRASRSTGRAEARPDNATVDAASQARASSCAAWDPEPSVYGPPGMAVASYARLGVRPRQPAGATLGETQLAERMTHRTGRQTLPFAAELRWLRCDDRAQTAADRFVGGEWGFQQWTAIIRSQDGQRSQQYAMGPVPPHGARSVLRGDWRIGTRAGGMARNPARLDRREVGKQGLNCCAEVSQLRGLIAACRFVRWNDSEE